MGRSPESSLESPAAKLERINREIDELVEKRKMLTHDMHVEIAEELSREAEEIDRQLMGLRIEQEFLKGETE